MRYHCFICGKRVTSELEDDSVIRAVLVCPECVKDSKVIFPEYKNKVVESLDKNVNK